MEIFFRTSITPTQHQKLTCAVRAHKKRNPNAAHAGRVVIISLSQTDQATCLFACIFTQGLAAVSLLVIELPRES